MQSIVHEAHGPPKLHVWGRRIRYRFAYWLSLLLLFAFGVIVAAPLVWALVTSLRVPKESFTLPPQWIPISPKWSNYREVFRTAPFEAFLLNSIVVAVSIVVGQLLTASLAGYAFARFKFPGKAVLFWIVMATMMIPVQATIIPVFVLISKLGLSDTLMSLILPAWPTAFGTFLLRQYFLTIPSEFEESAVIDGANQWQIFWRIYLPLAKPGLAVLAIVTFTYQWNDFLRPLIFLSSMDKFTVPLGLIILRGHQQTASVSMVLAGVVLSMIPVLVLFLFGQRYLIEGIVRGGLKG